MDTPKRNHDNNELYKHPRAWQDLKRALAKMGGMYEEFGAALEARADEDGMCVRLQLGAALYLWSTLSKAQRTNAFLARCDAIDFAAGKTDTVRPAIANGGQTTPSPAPLVRTSHPRLRRLLRWLRALELNTDTREILLETADQGIRCPEDTTLRELMDIVDQHVYPPAEAPARESLPESERASDAELLRFQWDLYGTGWPMPADLPDGVTIEAPGVLGAPPRLMFCPEGEYRAWRHLCPHCGRPYQEAHAYQNHLVRKHGWEDGPDGLTPPLCARPEN